MLTWLNVIIWLSLYITVLLEKVYRFVSFCLGNFNVNLFSTVDKSADLMYIAVQILKFISV